MKTCIDCGYQGEIDDFVKCTRSKDGHRSLCKPCKVIRNMKKKDAKPCRACFAVKLMDEFPTHPDMEGGHTNKCKICTRDKVPIPNGHGRKKVEVFVVDKPLWPAIYLTARAK